MSRNRKRLSTLGAVMLVVIVVIPILSPGAWAQSKYRTLHKFGSKDAAGVRPNELIFDQAGNLYGTTVSSVFKLTPNTDGSWMESVLYSFTNCIDGCGVDAGVIFDAKGNLYGTTAAGGANGVGTVFELSPNADGSWQESVLYSFGGTNGDGNYPYTDLTFDQAGNLYGTTSEGGEYDGGTVFELTPNADGSWKEALLHAFKRPTPALAAYPNDVIFDQKGNLYGTTLWGGVYNDGVVFKLMPNADGSWTEKVLHNFNVKGGGNPISGLIFDHAGNLYGVALTGGDNLSSCESGCGVVFELVLQADGSWREKVLHSFCSLANCRDGGAGLGTPEGGTGPALIFDQAGNLYSTTVHGGAYGWGTLFKLTPNSKGGWNDAVLHTFADHPGAEPFAPLISDPAGNLYGTTEGNGTTTFGSVFEITP